MDLFSLTVAGVSGRTGSTPRSGGRVLTVHAGVTYPVPTRQPPAASPCTVTGEPGRAWTTSTKTNVNLNNKVTYIFTLLSLFSSRPDQLNSLFLTLCDVDEKVEDVFHISVRLICK